MRSVPQEWSAPPATYVVSHGEVHVWRMNLEPSSEVEKAFRAVLSPDEISRADRFIRREHQLRFATGRGVLRYLLGSYCSLEPKEIRFSYNEFGKPFLTDATHDIHFNVSNSKAIGVVAVTPGRSIGVDIEQHRDRLELEKVARRYFSPYEVEALFSLDPTQQKTAFYRCWSSKEAFMKVCGKGLSLGLNRFDVEVSLALPPRVRNVPQELGGIDRWEMTSLPMGDTVAGVLALEGKIENVILYELDPASLL